MLKTAPLDCLLAAFVLLANGWLALDEAGIARRLFPDAATRALHAAQRVRKESPAMLLRREAAIRALQGRHPWAGLYHIGSQTLSVGPDQGYRQASNDGGWSDQGELQDHGPRLTFRSPNPKLGSRGPWIVPWGRRVYLIYDEQLADFANAVNDGTEPRHVERGEFFLREEDWSKPVRGRPLVPLGYRAYFQTRPLEARITYAARPHPQYPDFPSSLVSRVVLDVGRLQGVFPGMRLFPTVKERWPMLTVVSVSERSSEAEATFMRGFENPPRPGWRLSTRDGRTPPVPVGPIGGAPIDLREPWRLATGYGSTDDR